MIDFRYHLVSLISVFLALAVGIALGAGPLKESIGDTLTGQVDQLREERTQLRSDLDRSQADLQRSDQALDAVAPDLLADVLGERRVALVLLDDVPDRVRDGLTTRITQAGGSVPAVVHLTETWVDPTQTAFRQSLAGRLVEYLDPRPADDAGTGVELAEALVQGLTRGMPEDPDRLAEEAGIALQLLQEAGLVELDAAVEQPADAVVVVAGPTVTSVEAQAEAEDARSAEPEEAEAVEQRRAVVVDTAVVLARVAASRSAGAVLAGGDLVEGGALQTLRADQDAGRAVSTVESVQRTSGEVAVPLALAARIAGQVGHYGVAGNADDPMPPRIVLPVVERVVEPPPGTTPDDGTEGEPGQDDGDATDAADDGTSDEGGEG